ncbi:dihydrolipoyl dehydrogenase [Shewanella nanhaiensis]|uniref:Dihydrolipoyl dehydrogenase n=1 Tax=Shewanella nanhaiensis TaxID=2864872 RepID=A0ABS7E9L2_9GAMM|nr:dihydrolipoyl dehydrogenase [Shewanella nanhaiensis]MBW8186383.1 dihydrolipoyl dehydrogenase [Shewanella nanhaiensis]
MTRKIEEEMSNEIKTQVVVLGAGPAGYSAAFRAADLGLDTVIIERFSTLGGVCLNVGCIPSKALLHVSKVIEEAKTISSHGVVFGEPQIDLDKLREYKKSVIGQLTGGLGGMSKMRKVDVVNGLGKFTGPNTIEVAGEDGVKVVHFENAIIAAGSRPIQLPFIPHEDPRVWDSTDALELKEVPGKLLVMGGGIIGLEMGTVYSSLGSEIDVVEMFDQVIPAADKDVVRVFTKKIKKKFNLMLETKVTAVEAKDDGIYVTMEGKKAPTEPVRYDAVLVAIGRVPNGKGLDAEKAGVNIDERGFINVDKQMRTNVPHIYAIGDIVGQPMLAHKGVHEGHVAAEVISGLKHFFDPKVIPSIAYTDPEVAWVGLTEKEAKEQGIAYETATFPWAASGRAIASDCADGMTKLIFDKETHRVIGGAIVGVNGGELLGEIGLAIEMDCDAEDLALTIHAHPTLHESVGLAAEIYEGSITDLPNPKAKKKKK